MISVLIPVFNRNVNELVYVLSKQLKLLNNSAEIIVMDDGSEAYYKNLNCKLAGIEFVQYVESDTNHGRIYCRQKLAAIARYQWLLYLDCDSKIVSDQFLKSYCNKLNNSKQVIVGGRIYTSQKPTDCHFMLHWKYGTYREVMRFGNQARSNRFMTNNFFINKNIFERFDFTGGWSGYGYEDTWMGIQLEAMNVPVIFINNPVLHDGIETSSVFIAKSEEALENLKRLSELIAPGILIRHVRLYYYFYRLQSWRILWVLQLVYSIMKRYINNNLQSCEPSLLKFDLYRLHYFVSDEH